MQSFVVLLIDDDENTAAFFHKTLKLPHIEFHSAADGASGLEAARTLRPHLILLGLELPDRDGWKTLDLLLHHGTGREVITLSDLPSNENAVEAIRRGASDYVAKSTGLRRLVARILASAARETASEPQPLPPAALAAFREKDGIIGQSPAMLRVLSKIERIGPHFRTALITGETGTGKDLAARALHRLSDARGPLVVCNCAAIVESLFESELFGYQRGAFTGAVQDKMGLVEHAQGGTLFLDELGELPLSTQAKLLRVIQAHEVRRIGSSSPQKVDVRIIAATNRDLKSMVARRQFREDLYFRLALIEIEMPPLSQRPADLLPIANHFLDAFARLPENPRKRLSLRARTILSRYGWPGNVRELENVIAYGCMMSRGEVIEAIDLPEHLHAARSGPEFAGPPASSLSMREMRLLYIANVLEGVGGDRVRAARILKIGRTSLYRYLASHRQQ